MDQADVRLFLPADLAKLSEPKEEIIAPLFPELRLPPEEIKVLRQQPIVEYSQVRDWALSDRLHVTVTFEEQTFDLLLEEQLTVRDLLLYLRRSIKLGYWEAMYLGYQNSIFTPTEMLLILYNRYQVDNKLAIICRRESTFG